MRSAETRHCLRGRTVSKRHGASSTRFSEMRRQSTSTMQAPGVPQRPSALLMAQAGTIPDDLKVRTGIPRPGIHSNFGGSPAPAVALHFSRLSVLGDIGWREAYGSGKGLATPNDTALQGFI